MLTNPNTFAARPVAPGLRRAALVWFALCVLSQVVAVALFFWVVMLQKAYGPQGAYFFVGTPLRVALLWSVILALAFAVPAMLWLRLRVTPHLPRLFAVGAGCLAALFALAISAIVYLEGMFLLSRFVEG